MGGPSRTSTSRSLARRPRARATEAESCSPMASSNGTQLPLAASRSRSRIRPRSQREVERNGTDVVCGAERATNTPADPPTDTSAANRHHACIGHASQSGFRGLQNVAPTSMTACVHSPGRSAGTSSSAETWSPCASTPAAPPITRPRTRRTFVSTAPTGRPNARAATARAVYGPTPGRRSNASSWDGTCSPCSATMIPAAVRSAKARRL